MGYEIEMQKRILALLKLFTEVSMDRETHALVTELVANEHMWPEAHDLFDVIRRRSLSRSGDEARKRILGVQYSFEELCLKTVFNETDTQVPFDTNSSFWLPGSAFEFARCTGVPTESIIDVLAPYSKGLR